MGVDFADVTQVLEDEGVDKFIASWHELQATVATALEASRRRSSTMSFEIHLTGHVKSVVHETLPGLIADLVASGITASDSSLWGPDAEAEASQRLGWVEAVCVSRPLVPEIEALRAELMATGVTRVVLAGMGGSSLAPEVIAQTSGVPLVILDSTAPSQVLAAIDGDAEAGGLEQTVLVVSSKSGSTIETDSAKRAFEAAFLDLGIDPSSGSSS